LCLRCPEPSFFFSSRRRHTRFSRDWSSACALPIFNEDLAATAVAGSQLIETMPRPTVDGIVGIWYGKGPGVDRSGDALRHANLRSEERRVGKERRTGWSPEH